MIFPSNHDFVQVTVIFQSSNHDFSTNNSDLRARKSLLFELSNSDLSTSNVDIPDTSNCDLGASNGHVSDSSNLDLLYEFVTKSGCHGTWPNHDKCMAMELHTWAAVTVMHTVMWVCIVCSLLGMFRAVSANFASPSLDSRPSTFVKWNCQPHPGCVHGSHILFACLSVAQLVYAWVIRSMPHCYWLVRSQSCIQWCEFVLFAVCLACFRR